MDEKVLVIGLDGATFDIINPLIEQGKLPNLAKLMKDGVSGELNSTMPPISSLAWPSFFTGNNPGKHGIFGFQNCDKQNFEAKINLGSDVTGKKLWNILSENGKKVIVVNVEMTYPPGEVNGILIPGGATAPEIAPYPRELKSWLEEQGYVVEGKGYVNTPKKEFLEDLYNTTDKQIDVALKLMDKEPNWDFFMFLVTGTDRIQHYLWKDMDEKDEIYGDSIYAYYQHVDQLIGKLIEKSGENTTIIVISDHGFGRLKTRVHINNWLEKEGYLTIKPTWKNALNRFLLHVSSLMKSTGISEIIRQGMVFLGQKPSELRPSALEIDYEKTKAFSCGYYDGQIYMNPSLSADDYKKTRDEILEKLSELKDPQNGKKVFKAIYRKEEIYHGAHLEDAPDIVLLPEDEYWIAGAFSYPYLFESNLRETGRHEMEGIFLAYGDRIKKEQKLENAALIDVAPTILKLFNISAENMDGKVLKIFEHE